VRPVLVVTLMLAACAPQEPVQQKSPSPRAPLLALRGEGTAALVANSAEFSDYRFTDAAFTFAQRKSSMTPPMLDGAKRLAKAGWIRISGEDVSLTDKARSDKRFLVRSNGFVDVVPIGKKELIAVTAVHPESVDFSWKWSPNELGTVLALPHAGEQQATAKLMWDGTAWVILSIKCRKGNPACPG
jgi:hypothetical protein